MINDSFPVGTFQCNCHILVCPLTGDGVIIDPGDEPRKIQQALAELELNLGMPISIKYLFHTHAHFDHIGATRSVKESILHDRGAGAAICLHRQDKRLYEFLRLQGAVLLRRYKKPLPVDHFYEEDEEISVGHLKFSIRHTPGHTAGSVCLLLHENSGIRCPEILFSGDTLFYMGVGRTDLPGGSAETLIKSIRQRLFVLEDDTVVYPGHGGKTFIGYERRNNPFVR